MLIWFLLALSSAISNSVYNAFSKHVVSLGRFSKFTIVFWTTLIGSIILFIISYFRGFPAVDSIFWIAVGITAVINAAASPILLRAYQIGEFSSVYSMILLTPVFLLVTSFIFLGEVPTIFGVIGVVLTVFGLWMISSTKQEDSKNTPNQSGKLKPGILLAVFVAFLYSISVNFDKLAAQHSNALFAPAVSMALIAFLCGIYLLFKNRNHLIHFSEKWEMPNLVILIPLGIILGGSNILHNLALLAGLASYTIAVKRMGVLFGVFWGKLFFKEKDILKKLFGAAIAVAGVAAILFS